ncbi:hypothetical protein Nepgr_009728 [Nepenthes gracilis]|uniref:Uncharacterized protein n=1 Tax=Nepenthes gracilis TaxID=150966 RepID=A0AAD3XKE8_NEPGR|nr:hypothetical protein Nepgr_009728 [Nepenthes gracilis]
MRRHRGPVVAGSQAALSFTPTAAMDADHRHHHRDEKQGKNNVLSLDLDLNLPAPNDDHKESNFHFASKQPQEPPQQPPKQLVFSPPTLVDCHY